MMKEYVTFTDPDGVVRKIKRHKRQKIVERTWCLLGFALTVQTAPRCLTIRFLWGQHQTPETRFYARHAR